jgi:hypothetical protein
VWRVPHEPVHCTGAELHSDIQRIQQALQHVR